MSLTKELRDQTLINKLIQNMNPLFSEAMPVFSKIVNWPKSVYAVETETSNQYAVPQIQRGTLPIATGAESMSTQYIKPEPIEIIRHISADEVLDVETYTREGRREWINKRLLSARKVIWQTKNSMASLALTGTISWKIRAQNGMLQDIETAIGTPDSLSGSITGSWSASGTKLSGIIQDMQIMEEAFKDDGFDASTITYHVGRDVFAALSDKINSVTNPAKFRASIDFGVINLMGRRVVDKQFRYYDTANATQTIVPDAGLRMIAKTEHETVNMPIINLNANLRPLPIWTQVITNADGSGLQLHVKATPLYIPIVKAIKYVTSIT